VALADTTPAARAASSSSAKRRAAARGELAYTDGRCVRIAMDELRLAAIAAG
jgi:hypothetical protein